MTRRCGSRDGLDPHLKPDDMILARPSARQSATTFVVIAGVIAALHFAADVLIPIALALLLAFLLAPLVDRIQRTGANRATSVVLTTLVAFTVLGAVAYAVAHQFLGLVESLPPTASTSSTRSSGHRRRPAVASSAVWRRSRS
jgi:predicted PurR-regulated permease PerM